MMVMFNRPCFESLSATFVEVSPFGAFSDLARGSWIFCVRIIKTKKLTPTSL